MFSIKTAFLNIKRHKSKGVLIILICMLIVFFVSVYINSIETSEQQLADLPNAVPVTARVFNLIGSQIVGLEIKEERLLNTRDSSYVKDMFYTAQLAANFASLPNEENAFKEIRISAVNDIKAVSNIKDKKVEFTDGANENFLYGEDALCLAGDLFMQNNSLHLGDTLELALYAYVYNSDTMVFQFEPLGTCSLKIAGCISSATYASAMDSDLICPVGWAKAMHVKAGLDMYYDSATFKVADPLNLNAFKKEMDELGWMSVIPTAQSSLKGNTLKVRDETFITTAERLKNNLSGLYTFAPIILAVIALVGYAISYLLMQSRRRDIVIMRSLGTSRAACVSIMLLEFSALGLLGSLAGLAASALLIGFSKISTPLLALLFFVSFLLGILAAALQLSKRNIMSGLNKTEE